MDSGETPAKRQHGETEHLTRIICSANASPVELVNQTWWVTLLKAAELHDFQTILQLSAAEENIPDIFYHRECRSAFTCEKTLIRSQCKSANTAQDSCHEKQWASKRQPTSISSQVYEKICIFCEQSNKYIKRSHSREQLIHADEKVRALATIKMDNKILAVTSQELDADEAHYHKTCNRDYTREYYSQPTIKSPTVGGGDGKYADVEDGLNCKGNLGKAC